MCECLKATTFAEMCDPCRYSCIGICQCGPCLSDERKHRPARREIRLGRRTKKELRDVERPLLARFTSMAGRTS